MEKFLKLFFVLGPLAAQGVASASEALGVTHSTVALQIAGWVMALALAGRGMVSADAKNLKAP